MLRLPATIYMEMVGHCLAGLPDEACGLLVGSYGGDEATHLFPTRATRPPRPWSTRSTPTTMLRADRDAQALGADIMGVFHSHTHTDAYPSPTDVAQAPRPGLALRAGVAARHPPGRAQLPHRRRRDHRGARRRARARGAGPRGPGPGGPAL